MDRETLDGWALTIMALMLWGSIGTLAKASRVKWASFYRWYAAGIVAAGALLAASRDFGVVAAALRDATVVAIACGCAAGVCGCVGSMLFLSAIELVGVTLSYPVVLGVEMTVGTTLLYFVDTASLKAGSLAAALICVLGAVAFDALAQFQLMIDGERAAARAEATKDAGLLAGLRRPPPLARSMRSKSLGKVDFVDDGEGLEDDGGDAGGDDDAESIPFAGGARSPTLARSRSVDLLASARLLSDPLEESPRGSRPPPPPRAAPARSSSSPPSRRARRWTAAHWRSAATPTS